jgi:hypothetical protein
MMKKNYLLPLSLMFLLLFSAGSTEAQINTPRPSPNATVSQQIGLMTASISYSRPGVKGRKIFGDLVPFDKMWRTGANEPTKLSFSDSVTIEGNKLPAGDYALYTIPGQNEWTIILGKKATVAVGDYKDDLQAARFKVKSSGNTQMVESFTIDFTDVTSNSAYIQLSWENTVVRFKVETDVDNKVMAQIKSKLGDTQPYYQAASYYYDTNRDMKQALEWVNKDIEHNPRFFTLNLKAKIQMRMKDYKGAIESANKSIELAKAAKNDDYVRLNEKLIEECKKDMK